MKEFLISNGLIAIGIDSKTDRIKYTFDIANKIGEKENVFYLCSTEKDRDLKLILKKSTFKKSSGLHVENDFLYFTINSLVYLIENMEFLNCSTIFIDSIDSYIVNINKIDYLKGNDEVFTQGYLIRMLRFVADKFSKRIIFVCHISYGIHIWKNKKGEFQQSDFLSNICSQSLVFEQSNLFELNNQYNKNANLFYE